MKVYAGVDCGATNLRVGLFDEKGRLVDVSFGRSPLKTNPESLARVVAEEIEKFLGKHLADLLALGVGTPGPIEPIMGVLLPSANLGNSQPINLRLNFESLFAVPIYFDRDTNLALLGESWQGGVVGYKDVVMLTLGSGVGGAIMVNGEIEHGFGGFAGEIGHNYLQIPDVSHQADTPVCGLGHRGCFEALLNSASNLKEFSFYLGYELANLADIFNPQKIIIGGGKINMGNFLPDAIKVMKRVGIKPSVDEVEVEFATLKELSGIYGAAKLAMEA